MAGEFATDFDGTNDYLTRGSDLAGNADKKQFAISIWIRPGASARNRYMAVNQNSRVLFSLLSDDKGSFVGINSDGVTTVVSLRTTTPTTEDAWNHILMSANLATGASHVYLNDTEDKNEIALVDSTIEFTRNTWSIASNSVGTASITFLGAISEFYFNTAEYINFSVESNRRKFISAAGKPVPLGPDGSGPTGTAAIIYAPDGNPTVNQGTGGPFTENGAPVRIAGPNKRTVNAALISGV